APHSRIRSSEPTARIRPSRTATCVASGCIGFIVMILRACKTVAGAAATWRVIGLAPGEYREMAGAPAKRSCRPRVDNRPRPAVDHLDAPAAHPVRRRHFAQRRKLLRTGRLGHRAPTGEPAAR